MGTRNAKYAIVSAIGKEHSSRKCAEVLQFHAFSAFLPKRSSKIGGALLTEIRRFKLLPPHAAGELAVANGAHTPRTPICGSGQERF